MEVWKVTYRPSEKSIQKQPLKAQTRYGFPREWPSSLPYRLLVSLGFHWVISDTGASDVYIMHAKTLEKVTEEPISFSLFHCCGGILVHSSLQHCLNSLRFVGICWLKGSLEIPVLHFNQVEVWTLSGSPLGSFLLKTFCCRLAAVFGIIVLLDDPISAKRAVGQMASYLALEYFGIQRSSWSTQWLQNVQALWLQNKPK